MAPLTITELEPQRYNEIDVLVDFESLTNFISAIEDIQIKLQQHNIEPTEMYQYLLTLMLVEA